MFRRNTQAPQLTSLVPSQTAVQANIATPMQRQLRPLSPSEHARFIEACLEGLAGELAFFPRRLSHLRFFNAPELDGTDRVVIDFAPERSDVGVGAPQGAVHRRGVYHRLADIAPLLDWAASHLQQGRVAFDVSDLGSPDALSFSGLAGAPLVPDCHFLATTSYEVERAAYKAAPAWRERRDTVLWRGATTGFSANWRDLARTRLCAAAASSRPELALDCGFTSIVQVRDDTEIAAIKASGLLRDWVPSARFGEYRHHIDIDGNTNSWPGLFTKLLSGATVFKVTSSGGFTQWYYPRLEAWRHYVPIQADLSDLEERVAWARAHPALAEEVALEGQKLARAMTIEAEADAAIQVIRSAIAATGTPS